MKPFFIILAAFSIMILLLVAWIVVTISVGNWISEQYGPVWALCYVIVVTAIGIAGAIAHELNE